MDVFILSNLLLSIALIIQFIQIQNNNKNINPYTFILLALATFIMAMAQYKYGYELFNVLIKLFNGVIALGIVYYYFHN